MVWGCVGLETYTVSVCTSSGLFARWSIYLVFGLAVDGEGGVETSRLRTSRALCFLLHGFRSLAVIFPDDTSIAIQPPCRRLSRFSRLKGRHGQCESVLHRSDPRRFLSHRNSGSTFAAAPCIVAYSTRPLALVPTYCVMRLLQSNVSFDLVWLT